MSFPRCTIGIVVYNGQKYIKKLMDSIYALSFPKEWLEVVAVDNGSTDSSVAFIEQNYPDVRIFHNRNNFAAALNLIVEKSDGEYVAFLNTDMEVDRSWLSELLAVFEADEAVACVGSKILFEDRKTINSIGHLCNEDYYFIDKGFQEKDTGQYDFIGDIEGVCGGSILWKRAALEAIGRYDVDYIMYFEDVEIAHRCREAGYKIKYTYKSVVYHKYHGSGNDDLAYFLCNRNRLLFLAVHAPLSLPAGILTSNVLVDGFYDFLYQVLPCVLHKLISANPEEVSLKVLSEMKQVLLDVVPPRQIQRIISRYFFNYAKQKLKIAVYGPMDWLTSAPLDHLFDMVVIPSGESSQPDEWTETITDQSASYDIFINLRSDLEVIPLSAYSICVYNGTCPDAKSHSHLNRYDSIYVQEGSVPAASMESQGIDPQKIQALPADGQSDLIELMLKEARKIFEDTTMDMQFYLDAGRVK